MMPRIAVACALLAACHFDGDDGSGRYLCSDGVCPTGYACSGGECSAIDPGPPDAGHALTCADPEPLSGSATGDTASRTSQVAASCGGAIMNGPDAVYAVEATGQLHVSVTASFDAVAYVLATCDAAPATPACTGNAFAMPGSPITVAASGPVYVVVDAISPLADGDYTLTVE